MTDCCCEKQVLIQDRICACHIVTELDNTQRMFKKTACESVMNRLRSRMTFEFCNKCFIFHEVKFQCRSQIWIGNLTDICHQFLVHTVHTFLCCRHIISRIIFSFLSHPDLPDVHLKIPVIINDISKYFDKIFLIIIRNSL